MKDYLIRGIDESGKIRVFVARTTNMVEKARRTHDTAPTATAAMGRAMTASAIMGTMLKNEENTLTLNIKGNGPIGDIVMVSRNNGTTKGYVDNPSADVPSRDDNKLDVAGVVGNEGYISVIMDLGLRDPYVGQSNIISGEIAEDIAAYYAISEQQPSAVALGVLVDKDISVKASGGFIIQLLPGVSDEDIDEIEKTLKEIKPVSEMLDEGMTPEDILDEILGNFNMKILGEQELEFKCDCSRNRIEKALKSIGRNEIENILEEDGKAELVCHFCNTAYQFNDKDLEEIIEEMKD